MTEKFAVQLNNQFLSHERSGEISLTVPIETKQIEVAIDLPGKQWCHLTIHDEKGSRGQLLKTHQQTTVTGMIGPDVQSTSATMLAGHLTPGRWRLTYEVEGPEQDETKLALSVVQHLVPRVVEAAGMQDIMAVPPQNNKNGWVKGDFHTHTLFSDGKMTRENNLASAAKQELDFFVATDHQVVTHQWPETEIAVYAGVEITTNFGHANFLGVDHLLVDEYQLDQLQSPASILALIKRNKGNGLFSVNHPFLSPWAWELAELPLAFMDSLELCNDPTYGDNTLATEKALKLWSILWQDGWRITGVGGSDSHLLPTERYPESKVPSLIGDPATFVYVSSLTKQTLLKSVKNGQTIVSRTGHVELFTSAEPEVLPGQQMSTLIGSLAVALMEKRHVRFEWIVDGALVQTTEGTSDSFDYHFKQGDYHWLRVDIRELTGEFLATFTPVYWHEKEPTFVTWKEARDEFDR